MEIQHHFKKDDSDENNNSEELVNQSQDTKQHSDHHHFDKQHRSNVFVNTNKQENEWLNFVQITNEALKLDQLVDMVTCDAAGAVATFSGTTRNHFNGKKVIKLEYEAYVPLAEKELKKICEVVRQKWNLMNIAIVHRIGEVPIREASVIIVISSEHRSEALEAVHFAIDELKATVPVWKKEYYENGEVWKQNSECHFEDGRKKCC